MLKFDNEIVLSNEYTRKQIDGKKVCKLVSKRKKLPHKAFHMWKYNRMHQKDPFSEPLVHGKLCLIHVVFYCSRKKQWHDPNLALLQECVLTYIIATRWSSLDK